MRSTPHRDPVTAAPEATTAPGGPEAVTQKLDDTVTQGKGWLQNIDIRQLLEQIPQPVRGLGTQVANQVRRLTPTQQIVGGAVLAFGVGLLATHSSHKARTADAKAAEKYRAKYDG